MKFIGRECRQQHYSCRDLPEDYRDFDCELYRPTQGVGFQATKQLTVPDSFSVRTPHFLFVSAYFVGGD